ncbi:MAG: 23S rRNA (adenine(2503)-C(2))-methyltransferase RlmN [Phycisphaerales bacterium]|nr:23S rRNA (adenine(2503)-C(2))-methyltransferase RlmN [Planctomycetota bacterium]
MTDECTDSNGCSPLAYSAMAFVDRARTGLRLAKPAALEAYRRFFWTGGDRSQSGVEEFASNVAPISSVVVDEGAEGKIFKFTQDVPASETRLAGQVPTLRTESVLIPMIGKRRVRTYTLCVSSQVGCAMGCTFCETAQMGLIRSLTVEEIVQQWYAATHFLKHPEIPEPVVTPQGLEGPVRNIVFMGMGEPMDNLDNVLGAIDVLRDHRGPSIPISKITISTVGRIDGIVKLGEQVRKDGWHRLNLAISLNAADDEIRSRIMPVNRGMPLKDLQKALMDFPVYGGGKLCVEYVLIPGVNDTDEDARKIAEFLAPINDDYRVKKNASTPRTLLNLIPYNPRRVSPWPAPSEENVERFLARLIELGVYAKRRRTKGRDLMGACGQLGTEHIRQRKVVPLTVS